VRQRHVQPIDDDGNRHDGLRAQPRWVELRLDVVRRVQLRRYVPELGLPDVHRSHVRLRHLQHVNAVGELHSQHGWSRVRRADVWHVLELCARLLP
jgi:hypothetical protein